MAPALTFKTLLINGKHLNMLRDVAAPAEPKTVDLRSFNHRLGGATGPFLRDASPGSILPSVSGQHTLDAVVTGPISTFDSVAQFQQAFLDGKVGCAFPSQYIGSGDKFIIQPDGTRAFTPASAEAFFHRNFAPDRSRAETRIIAIPIAPAPQSHLLRRRSASAQAHVDARNRPRTADDLPPPPTSTPARPQRLVHPPKSRRSIDADLDGAAPPAAVEHIELNMTATEAAADCAHAVIHARAHSTSTAGIQTGKRAPTDDLQPLTPDAASAEDCAENRRRTAPRTESDAHCPRQTAPRTGSPDPALGADLERTAADPHFEGAPGLAAPLLVAQIPYAPPASAPPATTLSSDDEEPADENADPRHRRRAGSRQSSPARSPRKDTPPEPPAKQRRTSNLQAAARVARSMASVATNPAGMAAGVGACATAGGAPSAFTSLLTTLPAIVLILLAIAIIGSAIPTTSLPRPRHVPFPTIRFAPLARPRSRAPQLPRSSLALLVLLAAVGVEAGKKSKALYSAAVPDRPSNRDLEFGPGVGIADNWELCSPARATGRVVPENAPGVAAGAWRRVVAVVVVVAAVAVREAKRTWVVVRAVVGAGVEMAVGVEAKAVGAAGGGVGGTAAGTSRWGCVGAWVGDRWRRRLRSRRSPRRRRRRR